MRPGAGRMPARRAGRGRCRSERLFAAPACCSPPPARPPRAGCGEHPAEPVGRRPVRPGMDLDAAFRAYRTSSRAPPVRSTTSARTPPTARRPTGRSRRTSPCCSASGRRGWPTGSRCRSSLGLGQRLAADAAQVTLDAARQACRGRRGRHHGDRRHGGPHHHRRHPGHRARPAGRLPLGRPGSVAAAPHRGRLPRPRAPAPACACARAPTTSPSPPPTRRRPTSTPRSRVASKTLMAGEGLPMAATQTRARRPGPAARVGPARRVTAADARRHPADAQKALAADARCACTCLRHRVVRLLHAPAWPNGRLKRGVLPALARDPQLRPGPVTSAAGARR